jgi:hypothetical protein
LGKRNKYSTLCLKVPAFLDGFLAHRFLLHCSLHPEQGSPAMLKERSPLLLISTEFLKDSGSAKPVET